MTRISESGSAIDSIVQFIDRDPLTGLSSPADFFADLEQIFARAACSGDVFAIFYLGIDQFDDIDTAYGHEIVDLFLLAVARRLRSVNRQVFTLPRFLLARFSGDEFAILLANLGARVGAEDFSQQIRAALSTPYSINGRTVQAKVSIGVVLYSPTMGLPNNSLVRADLVVHRAGIERKPNQAHVSSVVASQRDGHTIIRELREAMHNGELELYYQPKVDIPSGRIVGIEALAYWNHPLLGLVPPAQVIAVAKHSGIVLAIEQWAIEETCKQLSNWRLNGCNPPIAEVHTSEMHLHDPGEFIRMIRSALHRSRLGPHALELSLSELALIAATSISGDVLQRLRDSGVRLAVNNFGVDHRALQQFQCHPVDSVKIATQLVTNSVKGDAGAAIARSAIDLAHALDLEVTADGVENASQASFLIAAGCRTMQGSHFCQPQQASHMTNILHRRAIAPSPITAANDTEARQ